MDGVGDLVGVSVLRLADEKSSLRFFIAASSLRVRSVEGVPNIEADLISSLRFRLVSSADTTFRYLICAAPALSASDGGSSGMLSPLLSASFLFASISFFFACKKEG